MHEPAKPTTPADRCLTQTGAASTGSTPTSARRDQVDLYREAGRRAGHPPESLKVGLHCFGYVADSDDRATDEFYPGWAQMFTQIGKERGFGPPVRAQYDAMLAPDGAFLIGDPDTVAAKVLRIGEDLGAWLACRCR